MKDHHKERGSRGQVCDRRVPVTNLPPRPSLFVQATESTFRVCVTHHSGEQLFQKKKLSQGGLPSSGKLIPPIHTCRLLSESCRSARREDASTRFVDISILMSRILPTPG